MRHQRPGLLSGDVVAPRGQLWCHGGFKRSRLKLKSGPCVGSRVTSRVGLINGSDQGRVCGWVKVECMVTCGLGLGGNLGCVLG